MVLASGHLIGGGLQRDAYHLLLFCLWVFHSNRWTVDHKTTSHNQRLRGYSPAITQVRKMARNKVWFSSEQHDFSCGEVTPKVYIWRVEKCCSSYWNVSRSKPDWNKFWSFGLALGCSTSAFFFSLQEYHRRIHRRLSGSGRRPRSGSLLPNFRWMSAQRFPALAERILLHTFHPKNVSRDRRLGHLQSCYEPPR